MKMHICKTNRKGSQYQHMFLRGQFDEGWNSVRLKTIQLYLLAQNCPLSISSKSARVPPVTGPSGLGPQGQWAGGP